MSIPKLSAGPRPALVAAALATCASPSAAQVLTTRASVDSNGGQGAFESVESEVSSDGRFVVFASRAPFDPVDVGSGYDIYLRDRQTGVTHLVSETPGGQAGAGDSRHPSVSGNGRYVAFESDAADLVPGDTNGFTDVFLRDMLLGTTVCLSRSKAGAFGDFDSGGVAISTDGLWVAFHSQASNLLSIPDANGSNDIYLYDRVGGVLTRVSVDSAGVQGNSSSTDPAISADGDVVVFESFSNNLVQNDTNGVHDIFWHEVSSGTTLRVSVDAGGKQGNGASYDPDVSGDGQRVVYESVASNLVPGDNNGLQDTFGVIVPQQLVLRLSESAAGNGGDGASSEPQISGDGLIAVFQSTATNLVPGDSNGNAVDVFAINLSNQLLLLVNRDSTGNQGSALDPAIDDDGSLISYSTAAAWPGDTNGAFDVYVSDPESGGRSYCTAGISASGCQALLATSGYPSRSLLSGYVISADAFEGSKDGIFFFGTNGRQANPWGNGTSFQCVAPPAKRTGVQSGVGTNGACDGFASLDFNAWMQANPTKAPPVGILTQLQFWYRDPQNPSNQTTSLSDALELVVAP